MRNLDECWQVIILIVVSCWVISLLGSCGYLAGFSDMGRQLGCCFALTISAVYFIFVVCCNRNSNHSHRSVIVIAIIMFLDGIVLFFLLLIINTAGVKNPFGDTKWMVAFVTIMLMITACLLSLLVYQGLHDIRRQEENGGLAKKADIVHSIAVAAASYAFLATALIVAITVLVDNKGNVNEQLKQIWIGVLASIATSIVVLSGTYLAGFSDFIVKVNETLESITGKIKDTKSELEKTGKSVTKSVEDVKSGVDGATDIFARESHLLSRQLVTLTTANRVQGLPEGDGRPSDAMLGAGSLHTAVLDAALTGYLAAPKEDVEKIGFSYARAGISGMLGAYLHESAYDIVGGTIITNVDNYANVMTGAAKHVGDALKSRSGKSEKHHNEEQESRSFFLLNTVVSPSHSLNWPWYTQFGKMPLRFAPDFLLRFITELRYFSLDKKYFIHGRLTTCESIKKNEGGILDQDKEQEHCSFPSPPWIDTDRRKKFSAFTNADRYIEPDGYPLVAKIPIKQKNISTISPFIFKDVDRNRIDLKGLEDIIKKIAEEHGLYGENENDNKHTLVAVWPLHGGKENVKQNYKDKIICGTSDCPFCKGAMDISIGKCFIPILDYLGLGLKTEQDNNFGGDDLKVKDRAKEWRLGNSDVEWLWGASRKKYVKDIETLIENKDWFKAASGILDIIGQIDRAKWTFSNESDTRITVRNAQRCLLVVANHLFHEHKKNVDQKNPLHLNAWFSEHLVSSPELAAVWNLDSSKRLAERCVENIGSMKKKDKKMTIAEVEEVIKAFYKKHFALSGIINQPMNRPENISASSIATALKEYAKCIICGDAQEKDGSISDMLLIEATTGRPWRVAEIAWRHGPKVDEKGKKDGDGHLKMDEKDAIAIWCYGHILENSSTDSDIAYPLKDWDKDEPSS
uniref:hypothetical protein n=1 Tax=Candidatus Electronema sp. TaxID=2698783 RepID=UPI00405757E0